MTIAEFYVQPKNLQRDALHKCCGSIRWVEDMLNQPKARTIQEMLMQAEQVWHTCSEADWLEAFSHHPKIGDLESLREKFVSTAQWASGEQASVQAAAEDVVIALEEENKRYENKFGFIFIICATGKSAEVMLEALQRRVKNAREEELRIAAEEQLKITKLRIQKLFVS